jgi:hypothetical protein
VVPSCERESFAPEQRRLGTATPTVRWSSCFSMLLQPRKTVCSIYTPLVCQSGEANVVKAIAFLTRETSTE